MVVDIVLFSQDSIRWFEGKILFKRSEFAFCQYKRKFNFSVNNLLGVVAMHFMRHNAKLVRLSKATMYDDVVFIFCMSAYDLMRKTMYTRVNNIILLELRIMAPPTGFDLQTTTSG